jgi:hypothetical protein
LAWRCAHEAGAVRVRKALGSIVLLVVTAALAGAGWDPRGWADVDTIELRTVGAEEGAHWSKVWVVVIDDQVYVRLGSRAASRVEKSTTAPYVGLRVRGQEFERVNAVPVPDDAPRVARAMADKYWSDVLVRRLPHPLTLRLLPEPGSGEQR